VTRAELLAYCLDKPGAWPDEPWENDTVVKVGSKIFAFLGAPTGDTAGVKCGPDRLAADDWVKQYPQDASASSYIGRYGWNTLQLSGKIPDAEIREAVDASYEAVVARLPRKDRPAG
jgi:predicted DNA-binding protein (MmcQ/YjbR family)